MISTVPPYLTSWAKAANTLNGWITVQLTPIDGMKVEADATKFIPDIVFNMTGRQADLFWRGELNICSALAGVRCLYRDRWRKLLD